MYFDHCSQGWINNHLHFNHNNNINKHLSSTSSWDEVMVSNNGNLQTTNHDILKLNNLWITIRRENKIKNHTMIHIHTHTHTHTETHTKLKKIFTEWRFWSKAAPRINETEVHGLDLVFSSRLYCLFVAFYNSSSTNTEIVKYWNQILK